MAAYATIADLMILRPIGSRVRQYGIDYTVIGYGVDAYGFAAVILERPDKWQHTVCYHVPHAVWVYATHPVTTLAEVD